MPVKVLIIRFSSIGDIVLTTPVVRCLKQQKPETEIHYLTKYSFQPVLRNNPYIDHIHYLDNDLDEVIGKLKEVKFDYVIDLHHNLRTLRVKKALRTTSYSFPKLNIQKWLLTTLKINLMPDTSIVDRYMETVKPLGIKDDCRGLDYFTDDQKLTNNDIPMSHWNGFAGFVIGGSYATKQLPAAQWKKLCALVPFPVILLGGPDDRELGDEIAADDPIRIYNSCGKFSLNESAELVKLSSVIVSNDTGLMHIAAAFHKPVISLWGNTTPGMGMFPFYGANNLKDKTEPLSVIVENRDLSCRPCSKLGYAQCPKKHFKCMNSLDMGFVALEVQRLWKVDK